MTTTKIYFALIVGLSLISAATIAGTSSTAEHSTSVNADELFAVFMQAALRRPSSSPPSSLTKRRHGRNAWCTDIADGLCREFPSP
jgi:hypothetical protein